MTEKGGYTALPHPPVEHEQQQHPGGYGSQGTTPPYQPQPHVQQPGYYDPQQQHVQSPGYPNPPGYNQSEAQPPQYSQPPFNPSAGYGPLPTSNYNQHTNVVVVSQPQVYQATTVVRQAPRANTYLTLAIVLFVLCFIHGNLPAFMCMIPALICASVASDHNRNGQYTSARTCGNMALCCSIFSTVYFVLLVIAGVTMLILALTIGVWSEHESPTYSTLF